MRGLRNLSLLEVCSGLADPGTNRVDPRKDRVTKFDLVELLFSAVIAVLCGAQSYVQMEIMAESKLDWIRPSACRFCRPTGCGIPITRQRVGMCP